MILSRPDPSFRPPTDPAPCHVGQGTILEISTEGSLHVSARAFALCLDGRARRQSLWPRPPDQREAYVQELLAASRMVGMIRQYCPDNGWVASCVALACPVCANAQTAILHFLGYGFRNMDEEGAWLKACREFLGAAHCRWRLLACAIPRQWLGPRKLCRALGFQELAQFPKAAIAYLDRPRLMDLAFLAHWPEQSHGSPAQA